MRTAKKWKTYEEVAAYLLNEFAGEFGLDRVEGMQKVKGLRSGTQWTIDAKGVRKDADIIFVVECHRYTTSKQSQEKLGGLAYRILDTGAAGGIIVSPLGLQEGAAQVATAENVYNVILDENSTTTDYVMRFLNQVRLGISDRAVGKEHVDIIRQCARCNSLIDRNDNGEYHCKRCEK